MTSSPWGDILILFVPHNFIMTLLNEEIKRASFLTQGWLGSPNLGNHLQKFFKRDSVLQRFLWFPVSFLTFSRSVAAVLFTLSLFNTSFLCILRNWHLPCQSKPKTSIHTYKNVYRAKSLLQKQVVFEDECHVECQDEMARWFCWYLTPKNVPEDTRFVGIYVVQLCFHMKNFYFLSGQKYIMLKHGLGYSTSHIAPSTSFWEERLIGKLKIEQSTEMVGYQLLKSVSADQGYGFFIMNLYLLGCSGLFCHYGLFHLYLASCIIIRLERQKEHEEVTSMQTCSFSSVFPALSLVNHVKTKMNKDTIYKDNWFWNYIAYKWYRLSIWQDKFEVRCQHSEMRQAKLWFLKGGATIKVWVIWFKRSAGVNVEKITRRDE